MNPTRARAIEDLRQMVLETLGKRAAEVWLFGSCARGDARQHSDIDIAILPHDQLPSGFFAELAADFEESTIPYDVDRRAASLIAPLDTLTTYFLYQGRISAPKVNEVDIIRDGALLEVGC